MARVYGERELPTSKSLSMSRNSKLHPLGLRSTFSPQLVAYHSTEILLLFLGEIAQKPNQTKQPKQPTKKSHPNQKKTPKPHTFPGFYQSAVFPTPLTSQCETCSVLDETAHSFTPERRGTSFKK